MLPEDYSPERAFSAATRLDAPDPIICGENLWPSEQAPKAPLRGGIWQGQAIHKRRAHTLLDVSILEYSGRLVEITAVVIASRR